MDDLKLAALLAGYTIIVAAMWYWLGRRHGRGEK
jgi:hypothetical protein